MLADRGRTEEAIARYREALQIAPAHANAHRLLGMALRAQGHVAEARAHLTEALRIAPDDAYRKALDKARFEKFAPAD